MKKMLLSACLLSALFTAAQGIAINNNGLAADNSAILDVQSTSKGVLLPRMTTLQRTTLSPLTTGLTVYDTDTQSYWMYRGDLYGGWAELQHSFQKAWELSGSNIYNFNSGNVGIGTNNPVSRLTINGTNPAIGFLNSGITNSYLRVSGQHIKLATAVDNLTGNIVFSPKETDRVWIDEDGLVGIGTSNPGSLLTVSGSNPRMQLRHLNVDKGFMQLTGNDFQVGTNAGNTTGDLAFQTKAIDRMVINENGQVGIGTSSPASHLTINGTNPQIQLRQGEVDKGFIQVSDDLNLRVGTNQSNTWGSFVVRTKGFDRLFVNYDGKMGLNVAPSETSATFVIGESESGTSGVELSAGGTRRAMFNWNGFNSFLTANVNDLVLYRQSNSPIVLHNSGNFSMGTWTVATGYKLSVGGKIIGTEVTALPMGSWPDYVFSPGYRLPDLREVKKFIETNGHLPGMQPASVVEKEGIQLGETSRKLLEKVEELTLYVISLQEELDRLKRSLPAKAE